MHGTACTHGTTGPRLFHNKQYEAAAQVGAPLAQRPALTCQPLFTHIPYTNPYPHSLRRHIWGTPTNTHRHAQAVVQTRLCVSAHMYKVFPTNAAVQGMNNRDKPAPNLNAIPVNQPHAPPILKEAAHSTSPDKTATTDGSVLHTAAPFSYHSTPHDACQHHRLQQGIVVEVFATFPSCSSDVCQ